MQFDLETIAAIEAIVNRVLDEREAQKAAMAEHLAAQVRRESENLLGKIPDAKTLFNRYYENAIQRQQTQVDQAKSHRTQNSEALQ